MKTRRLFFESGTLAGTSRVDRAAGIVHGVRVIGRKSDNGREYLPEALQRAIPLYEGASVRINHPKRPDDQRATEDVLGWLENVRAAPDGGLIADLHLLTEHELAARVMEAAERNPRLFGLSHNAQGEGEVKGGVFVVHEITEVRSVDLVADPATTKGLFESRGQRMKIKAFLEQVAARLSKGRKARLVKLCEADELAAPMAGDMPTDAPAPDASSPEDALKAGFRSACMAVLDDDSMDAKGKMARLKELLTTAEKLMAAGADVPEEDHEEPDGDEDMEESRKLRKENAELKAREAVRDLCEQAGYRPTATSLVALVALPDEGARKALIAELKEGRSTNTPRTQNTGGKQQAVTINDGKGFAEALRRGNLN
jgi:nucleotide-binding universal stress UspA family protein